MASKTRRKLTPKQRVLKKWPKARSYCAEQSCDFVITKEWPHYAPRYRIGIGEDAVQAWADAARRITRG